MYLNKYKNYIIFLLFLQLGVYFSARFFEVFDRFGTGTIRLSYGSVASVWIDLVVVFLQLTLLSVVLVLFSNKNYVSESIKYAQATSSGLLMGFFAMLPLFIFGQDSGFFWTVPLFYASIFLIVPWICTSKKWQFWLFCYLLMFSLNGSKSSVVYLIISFYIFHNKHIGFSKIIYFLILFVFGMVFTMYVRDEFDRIIYLPLLILWREYALEITGLAINYVNQGYELPFSVILNSFLSLVPNYFYPGKIQVGHEVPKYLLPDDVLLIPDAGFYLSIFSLFILDIGFIGIFFAEFLWIFILFMSKKYIQNNSGVSAAHPFLFYIHFLINGEITFYFSHAVIAAALIKISKVNIIK